VKHCRLPSAAIGLVLLSLLLVPAFSQERTTVAVFYFENNSLMNREAYDGLRKGLCDIMITELGKIGGLQVVERERLEKAMAEMALGQTGALDPARAPQVGKVLGAQVLMLGSFIAGMNGEIRMDTRLVRTETGAVIKAEEVTGKAKQLFKLINKLSLKLADELDVSVTKEEKKRMESSDEVSLEGLVAYAAGLELWEKGDREGARKKFQEALDRDRNFTKAREYLDKIKAEGGSK
jgi:TolB-like protein